MRNINDEIIIIDNAISKNISRFDDSERGLLSQNILAQLRNLVELVSLKAYDNDTDVTYENFQKALNYIKSNGKFKFLSRFYDLLQPVASHYTMSEENSERLMLKYYEYLLRIKSHLKDFHNLDVFVNIDEFPLDVDSTTKEYYEKISQQINLSKSFNSYSDRYYIKKKNHSL